MNKGAGGAPFILRRVHLHRAEFSNLHQIDRPRGRTLTRDGAGAVDAGPEAGSVASTTISDASSRTYPGCRAAETGSRTGCFASR